MIRAAGVCVLLVAALAIGCRGDLFRPEPVEETGASLDEEWTPDVVVIGPDGTPRENFTVSFDNTWYYGDGGPLASRRRVTSQTVENGVVRFPAVPIVPPFFVSTGGSPFPVLLHDVVPPADGPLVIDLSEPTHWLRYELPEGFEEWSRVFVNLHFLAEPALASVPPRSGRSEVELFRVIEPAVTPLVLSPAIDELWRLRAQWPGSGRAFEAAYEPLERLDLAPGDTLVVRPPLRRLWVDVRQGGEPAPSIPVAIDVRASERLRFGDDQDFVRTTRVLDGEPVEVVAMENAVAVRVLSITPAWFLSRAHVFDVAVSDTVVVELGLHRVSVRVEDADGTPLRGRSVRVDSQTDVRIEPVELATGPDGQADFRLDTDFYELAGSVRDSVVYVDRDTTFVFVEGTTSESRR